MGCEIFSDTESPGKSEGISVSSLAYLGSSFHYHKESRTSNFSSAINI